MPVTFNPRSQPWDSGQAFSWRWEARHSSALFKRVTVRQPVKTPPTYCLLARLRTRVTLPIWASTLGSACVGDVFVLVALPANNIESEINQDYYVCMVITYSNSSMDQPRVRLPILLVVSWTGKTNISLSPFAPENLVSGDGLRSPVPRQPAHLYTQA